MFVWQAGRARDFDFSVRDLAERARESATAVRDPHTDGGVDVAIHRGDASGAVDGPPENSPILQPA